jgi:hypothetical protein
MSSLLKAVGHHLFAFRKPSTTLSHGRCVLTRSKSSSLLASNLYSLLLAPQSKRVSRFDQGISRAIQRNRRQTRSVEGDRAAPRELLELGRIGGEGRVEVAIESL